MEVDCLIGKVNYEPENKNSTNEATEVAEDHKSKNLDTP